MSLHAADAVVLCYAANDPVSLQRLETHWLREVRRTNHLVPVLLVGLKAELRGGKHGTRLSGGSRRDCTQISMLCVVLFCAECTYPNAPAGGPFHACPFAATNSSKEDAVDQARDCSSAVMRSPTTLRSWLPRLRAWIRIAAFSRC